MKTFIFYGSDVQKQVNLRNVGGPGERPRPSPGSPACIFVLLFVVSIFLTRFVGFVGV